MTTTNILSLPPEIISYILDISCEFLVLRRNTLASQRFEQLKSFSLISKSFTGPAQEQLWKKVQLWSQLRAQQFLTTNLDLTTKELHLGGIKGIGKGHEGMSSSVGTKIINSRMTRGLKTLILSDFSKLSSNILIHPNLGGLKNLTISTTLLPPSTKVPFVPHFKLTHLNLYSASYDPSILLSILSVSSSTLIYLNISLPETSIAYSGLLSGLKLVGKNLKEINLSRRIELNLIKELKWCTGVKFLGVGFASDLSSILNGLSEEISPEELETVGTGEQKEDEKRICQLERLTITLDYNLLPAIQTISERLFPQLVKPVALPLSSTQGTFTSPSSPSSTSTSTSTTNNNNSKIPICYPIFTKLRCLEFGNASHWKGYEVGIDGFVKNCQDRGVELIFAGNSSSSTIPNSDIATIP